MKRLLCYMCMGLVLILVNPFLPLSYSQPSFQKDIRPILEKNCLGCHSTETHQGGLVTTTFDSLLKGGALDGPAVIPGNSRLSPLVLRLRGEIKPQMPLGGDPLSEKEIILISQWIDQVPTDTQAQAASDKLSWPWTKLALPEVPQVKRTEWVKNPIDAFILATLEEKGMDPAPTVSDRALLRRLYFGLIGLPPSPDEMEQFLKDTSADAVLDQIEKLLANPAYGERWGRHWLDLVKYSDTVGESVDYPRPHMWRYRDYVVRAFNQDMPYDRFVRQQVAGDTYRKYGIEGKVATGFLHQWVYVQRVTPGEPRRDFLNDVVASTGSVFLGVTLGCARCHDHKFDPIPTRDYYRMEAFFAPITVGPVDLPFTPYEVPHLKPEVWEEKSATWKSTLAKRKESADQVKAELKTRVEKYYQLMSPQDLKDWVIPDLKRIPFPKGVLYTEAEKQQLKIISRQTQRFANVNSPDYYKAKAYVASDSFRETNPSPPVTYVLKGGNFKLQGETVKAGFFSTITGDAKPANLNGLDIRSSGGSPRKVLAEWIASSENPLTARVMVNRIWQHHFSRGLASTPSDLGKNGGVAVHHKLIDWLACQFIESGWSIKDIHRLILQSNVYRQSLRTPHLKAYQEIDSDNLYLWRRSPVRIEAEVIRDTTLAVSGQLNLALGGPPFFPDIKDIVQMRAGVWWEPSQREERSRRSLYVVQCRSLQLPMMTVFDGASINESCPNRDVTTVTPQVFALFNSKFSHEQSRFMADRILSEVGNNPDKQIERAFQLAFQRSPTAFEKTECLAFLHPPEVNPNPNQQPQVSLRSVSFEQNLSDGLASQKGVEKGSLSRLCLVLINMNEFIFLQ